jgi:hypothetical protein
MEMFMAFTVDTRFDDVHNADMDTALQLMKGSKGRGVTASPRSIHLIDLENAAGTTALSTELVSALQALYMTVAEVSEGDHVVIATSHYCAPSAWFGWGGNPRRLVRSGPDGADLSLLEVIERERVIERFDRVVIASGDGIFSMAAAQLQAAGLAVTVVTRPGSLHRQLRFAVRDVRLLMPTPALPAVGALPYAA